LTRKCFSLTGKCFPLTGKCFPLTGKCSPLTGKCFPLTNFPNDKQTWKSLESGFPESEFQETNMAIEKTSFTTRKRRTRQLKYLGAFHDARAEN